ncbi:hypothetical protein MP478_01820 [Chryseobacterium sp. WG14]|uniref:hypothetical protein n=1 Tax=Chryseobacterium sp. WG14 TaxID=2926909 RepID=UPI00211E3C5A|nr:hypothetical protein [Chryseobacterium sp. WG14]MCQ9638111.1 hypothetical protein [Chryseobacterium sp. WG14]
MELFNVINSQQNYGKIKIQRGILKTNPNWKKHFEEIELIDYQGVKINIYSHTYIDFFKIFKNLEFNYYLLEKEKNQFLTTEKYIEKRYFADIKILENILFSKNSQEEHNGQLSRDVEISHFPKHFEAIADDLIYTYEKIQEKVINYVFIIGEINFYQYNTKDYFNRLYKFLKEEIYLLFNELEKNHKAIKEQQSTEDNLLYRNKFSDFINEVEVFKADTLSDFAINIGKNGNHDYNYFLDYINSTENKFDNANLIKYVIVSYFTEDEIITYLQNSFKSFKEKYIYATIYDYFKKNDDFKFLSSRIKEIDYYILGNNLYQDSYSFRPKDKFDNYGTYKNHLVYYYNKTFYFFDLKYFDSDNIDMHFKHMNKIFDRDREKLLRRHTTGYKGDGLEKKITSEIESQLSKSTNVEKITVPQKIKIKGSLQSVGYLFSELIEKGFIEAPKRNGKDNTSAISRMILDHFEFIDKEEQPKPEDIRKTLFTENKLSIEKQNQFKIPNSKIINTD